MKRSLCVVGLILLLTTLTEGSAFRHDARKQVKKPSISALKKPYLKTPLGKYVKEFGLNLLVMVTNVFDHLIWWALVGFRQKMEGGSLNTPFSGLEAKKNSLEAAIFIGLNPRSNWCLRPFHMMGLGRFQEKNGGQKPYHTIFWVGGPETLLEASIFIGLNPRSNQCLRPSHIMGLGRFQPKNGGRKP